MKMSDVFNLPLSVVEPVITTKGAWPVVSASVEGCSVRGHIGKLEIKQGPYTGSGKYLDLELAKHMANMAAFAINNHDRLEQENAEIREILQQMVDQFECEHNCEYEYKLIKVSKQLLNK